MMSIKARFLTPSPCPLKTDFLPPVDVYMPVTWNSLHITFYKHQAQWPSGLKFDYNMIIIYLKLLLEDHEILLKLFVPRVRTMTQTRSFSTIRPSLWNTLHSSLCLTLLSGTCSASLTFLKTYFYYRGFCTGSATEWSLLWMMLYKYDSNLYD